MKTNRRTSAFRWLFPNCFVLILTACAALLWNCEATAQNRKKWDFSLSLGGELNSGNVNDLSVKSSGDVKRNDSLISFNANYNVIYKVEDEEETNKGISAGVKLDLYQYNRWSPFIAGEFLTNRYKGYNHKFSVLTGVKLRIFTKPDVCDYSISAAFVFDKVEYTPDENKLGNRNYRISLRPKIRQKIGNVLSIKHHTFYQPSLEDFSDHLINSSTSLECKVSKYFYLTIGFQYEFRSRIPTSDYKHHDVSSDVMVKVKF